MTDDTLVNGLKAIFGTSAQGSAPASSALIPYMDASGNPVGLSSMANLASVLGGIPSKSRSGITDFNQIDYSCIISFRNDSTTQISNCPIEGWGNFVSIKGTSYVYQICSNGSAIYQRFANQATWLRVDNFGCSTPADLASLLGVGNVRLDGNSTVNVESLGYGTFIAPVRSCVNNVPTEIASSHAIAIFRFSYGDGHISTIIYDLEGTAIYRRMADTSAWR